MSSGGSGHHPDDHSWLSSENSRLARELALAIGQRDALAGECEGLRRRIAELEAAHNS